MKKIKRAATLLLSLALALSLAACAGGGTAGTPAASDKDPVKTATEKMATAKNMETQMVMTMDMDAQGQTVSSVTTMNITLFTDPVKMKAEVSAEAAGASQTALLYAEGDTMYTSADGTTWVAQATTAEDLSQYDVKASMEQYLALSSGFKESGTDKLDGGEATKYVGIIPGKDMEALMAATGTLNSLTTSTGITEEQMKDVFTDMADLPVTFWIDKATGYPAKYDMDMTDMMAELIKKILVAAGQPEDAMAFTKMAITITISNVDKATAFEIPAEAKAAA